MLARTTRRGRIGLIAGLVTAGVGITLVLVLHGPSNAPPPSGGATAKALVAVKEIPSGSVITADEVAVQDTPAAFIPFGAYTQTAAAVGRYAAVSIHAHQVIVPDWVQDTPGGGGPGPVSSRFALAAGDVAMAIPVDPMIAVGYYIQPNDRVDMIFQVDGANTVRYGLQDVLILSIGSSGAASANQGGTGSGAGVSRADNLIIVELPRRQAEELAAVVNGCPSACGVYKIAKLVLRPRDQYGKGYLTNGTNPTIPSEKAVGAAQLASLFPK